MKHSLFEFLDRNAGEAGTTFHDFPYMHQVTDSLERCVVGELPDGKKNLAITLPPRCFKTEIVSRVFPAWCLCEVAPDAEFILASAGSTLAADNSIGVHKILTSEWVGAQYPDTRIDAAERELQQKFKTTLGGSLYSVGLGGAIIGFGAGKARGYFGGALIIDDPIKAEDARSKTIRQKCIRYYNGTLRSRLNSKKSTPIILVMQRLHPDDLVGYLAKAEPDSWHILSLPARNDNRELLNPVTLSNEELDVLLKVDPATYWAQYMCSPIVEGGNIIKLDWWRFYDPAVQRRRGAIFLTADTAFKEKSENDASVIRAWEIGLEDGNLYCLDAVYGRMEFPRLLMTAKDFWQKWAAKGAQTFWIEDKASGTPLEQTLLKEGVPARAWNPSHFEYPTDKPARMRIASRSVHAGRILLPRGKEEVSIGIDKKERVEMHAKVLMEECSAFSPDMSHAFDDHCDTLTMADSLWRWWGGGRG